MTVGKPNFNLNSFGVKYLSKDEVQEFLNKYEVPHGDDQAALRTEREGKQGGKFQASESSKKLLTPITPKPEAEKPATATSSTISAPNAAGNKKLQGGTRSQFMSREDTTPKSNYAKQIAGDIKEARGKVDESGIVSRGGEQSGSGEHKGKKNPAHRIQPLHGKNPDGNKKDDSKATGIPSPKKQELGTIIGDGNTGVVTESGKVGGKVMSESGKEINEITGKEETKKDKKDKKQSGGSEIGRKQLPKHTGDAPEGTKSETKIVDGRNTKVGVGVKAHKKLEKDPQGELTSSQKPKEDKPDGRKVDLNTQHRSSKGVQSHNKRSKENMKYYNEEQRAAYKKIPQVKNDKGEMVDDRTAQSKFHDEQDKKYGKSVSTPKKLSSAGQSIKDKLSKKSNDIITEMNIMKLDLMKENKFQETSTNARISPSGDTKHLEDIGIGEGTSLREASTLDGRTGSPAPLERKDPPNKMGGKTGHAGSMPKQTGKKGTPKVDPRMRKKDPIKTIPKTASETIFKAISLKLDLTTLK
jgi:hypothetical protein